MNNDSLLNDVVELFGVLFLIVIKALIWTAIFYVILVIVPSKIIEFFCQDSTTQDSTTQLTCKADNVDKCISTFKASSHGYEIDHMIEMTDDSVVFSIKKVK